MTGASVPRGGVRDNQQGTACRAPTIPILAPSHPVAPAPPATAPFPTPARSAPADARPRPVTPSVTMIRIGHPKIGTNGLLIDRIRRIDREMKTGKQVNGPVQSWNRHRPLPRLRHRRDLFALRDPARPGRIDHQDLRRPLLQHRLVLDTASSGTRSPAAESTYSAATPPAPPYRPPASDPPTRTAGTPPTPVRSSSPPAATRTRAPRP